jgi:selenium metabolism protein YedF
MKNVDVRGMSCPAPVVSVKRALENAGGELRVLLDDGAPRENVKRFAQGRGYSVQEEATDGGFALTLTISAEQQSQQVQTGVATGPTVLLIGSDRLGDGPEELGRVLMRNFIMTLVEVAELPDRMLFINTGVLLTAAGSEVLEALEALGNRGVEVLSCGICLDFFKKKESLAAGGVTNMFTIAESLLGARSVIRL